MWTIIWIFSFLHDHSSKIYMSDSQLVNTILYCWEGFMRDFTGFPHEFICELCKNNESHLSSTAIMSFRFHLNHYEEKIDK